MNCPICNSELEFMDDGMYVGKRSSKKPLFGKYYLCPECGSEILKRSGGSVVVVSEGMLDLCTIFENGKGLGDI